MIFEIARFYKIHTHKLLNVVQVQ